MDDISERLSVATVNKFSQFKQSRISGAASSYSKSVRKDPEESKEIKDEEAPLITQNRSSLNTKPNFRETYMATSVNPDDTVHAKTMNKL